MAGPILLTKEGRVIAVNAAATVLGEAKDNSCAEVLRARTDGELACSPGCALRLEGANGCIDRGRVRIRGGWWRLVCSGIGGHVVIQMLEAEQVALTSLTPREREIVGWIGRGCTNKEIGRRLSIQPTTVRTHVERLLAKLGARTRAEAVALSKASFEAPSHTRGRATTYRPVGAPR